LACLGAALAAALLTLLTAPLKFLPNAASDLTRDVALQAQFPGSIVPYAAMAEATLPSAAFGFLERITDEERLTGGAMRSLSGSWMPAGGMSVLTYGGATKTTTAASEDRVASEIPIPIPSPLLRSRAAANLSASTASSQLAQMNGDSTQEKSFDLLGWLFSPRDDAAKRMLASNPQTAVYEIASRKLYLPGGQTLEAHSGFGEWMDKPTSVAKRSIGATPPNVYKVSLRPALFHGVKALRLTPEDQSKMFGRSGFLAHPFMLGENGQSNGCVSIKDYDAFLRAYQDGQVTRLIVVPQFDDTVVASSNENS
jgi:hypothetical protein